jgi:hypothetical protein
MGCLDERGPCCSSATVAANPPIPAPAMMILFAMTAPNPVRVVALRYIVVPIKNSYSR